MAEPASFPAHLVQHTTLRHELRFVHIGQHLVFLGHIDPDDVRDTTASGPQPVHTWARVLTHCPDHLADHDTDCYWCDIEVGAWWLDWSKPDGADHNHNANAPGYFPVTTWETP